MSLPPKLQETLDLISLFPDRADRVQALISIADRFVPIDESLAAPPYGEGHRVPHCESEAFAWAFCSEGGGLSFRYAVQNPQGLSAMAMAVILQEGLEGVGLEEVLAVPDDLPYVIFGRELSMGKSAGLMGMVQLTKGLAKMA